MSVKIFGKIFVKIFIRIVKIFVEIFMKISKRNCINLLILAIGGSDSFLKGGKGLKI